MRKVVLFGIAAALVLLAIAATLYVFLRPGPLPKQANAPQMSATTQVINQGEYLARVGDCVACHSEPTGKPFAGGRAMATPFGNIYTSNITPDDETGIGRWTADDFYRMMHTGISRDGTLLYPAMPFAQYTKVTRADCDAKVVLPPSSPLRDKIGSTVPRKFATPSKSAGLWGTRVVTGGRMISTISEAGNANRSPAAVNSSTSSVLDVESALGIAQDFVL